MRQFFLSLFQIAMRSVVMMAFILTIGLSIITQEFPPDFRRIAKTYEQVQNFHRASNLPTNPTALNNNQDAPTEAIAAPSEEAEIQKLSDLYEKRAMIGRSLIDPKTPRSSDIEPIKSIVTNGEVEILKARLLTCEDQLKLYENLDSENEPSKEESR